MLLSPVCDESLSRLADNYSIWAGRSSHLEVVLKPLSEPVLEVFCQSVSGGPQKR